MKICGLASVCINNCIMRHVSYLNENRETVAGHGCASRMSFRAEVVIGFEFTLIAILASSDGSN